MRAFAFERVEVERQGRGEGFALSSPQLRDTTLVQIDAADELNIVVALPEGALAGFANRCEGFRQEGVERLAICQTGAEFIRFCAELRVAEIFELRFERVDLVYDGNQFVNYSLMRISLEDLPQFFEHNSFL